LYIQRKNQLTKKDMKKLSEIKIKDGGLYMANNNLTSSKKAKLTSLFADLVDIPTPIVGEPKTYQLIPPIIRKFASGSRVLLGHRLLRRAVRHGIDPRTPDIRHARGHIIEEKGEIGLSLHHQVKASMRQEIYQIQVAFTSSGLVTCSCNCKAGSMGEEQIVCVHILPVLFQLTQVLYFGMSQHIQIEASNFFNGNTEALTSEEESGFIHALKLLLRADIGYIPLDDSCNNIQDILHRYSVGTERAKSRAFLLNKYCYKTERFKRGT
jgi:hypothetical protein